MERTLRIRFIRLTGAALLVLAAVVLPVAPWVVPVMAGAIIAYDGPSSRAVRWLIGGLCAAELLGAAPLGAWSLPVAVAALTWQMLARVVPLAPWASREGWSPVDGIVTAVAAVVLAIIISLGSAVFMALTGASGLSLRLSDAAASWWPVFPVAVVFAVVVLRRLDTPLRQKTVFSG